MLGGEEALDRLLGRFARERHDRERADDRRGDVLRSLHRRERHEPRAVGEVELRRRARPRARAASCRHHRARSASARRTATARAAARRPPAPRAARPIVRFGSARQRARDAPSARRAAPRGSAVERGDPGAGSPGAGSRSSAPGSIPSCLDEHLRGRRGRPPAPRPGGRCDTARASAAPCRRSRQRMLAPSAAGARRTSSACRPAARSASTRAPRATRRCSSSRAISAGANGANPNSASGGPAPQRQRLAQHDAARARRRPPPAPAGPPPRRARSARRQARPGAPAAGSPPAWSSTRLRVAERLAQPRHVHLHRLHRPRRRVLAPQRHREALRAHRLVGVQQQHRQHRARLEPAERHRADRRRAPQAARGSELHRRPRPTLLLAEAQCPSRSAIMGGSTPCRRPSPTPCRPTP